MSPADDPSRGHDQPEPNRSPCFATTQWSMVLRAGGNDSRAAQAALSRLCQVYWYPLYAYVRRRGYAAHDAQDLTQAFFVRVVQQDTFGKADPARGRFRSFILTSLSHFLASEWEKARAQKRGGPEAMLSLDFAAAERRYDVEPIDPESSPDRAFDRQWALTLLETVLEQLQAEYARGGKEALFAELRSTLTATAATPPYAQIATRLGLTEGAVKLAVHRLRHRYRELIRAEIAETVDSAEASESEMQHLFRALSGG